MLVIATTFQKKRIKSLNATPVPSCAKHGAHAQRTFGATLRIWPLGRARVHPQCSQVSTDQPSLKMVVTLGLEPVDEPGLWQP